MRALDDHARLKTGGESAVLLRIFQAKAPFNAVREIAMARPIPERELVWTIISRTQGTVVPREPWVYHDGYLGVASIDRFGGVRAAF